MDYEFKTPTRRKFERAIFGVILPAGMIVSLATAWYTVLSGSKEWMNTFLVGSLIVFAVAILGTFMARFLEPTRRRAYSADFNQREVDSLRTTLQAYQQSVELLTSTDKTAIVARLHEE